MARKPNYQFERSLRDRAKEAKVAEKAAAKRAQREADRPLASTDLAATTDEAD